MTHRYLRYATLGLRILCPTPAEWRYARAIMASGLFDRAWYLGTNPRLPRLCRWLPERHYVLVGEAVGLCPSPAFSPLAYLHLNPDLPKGTRPLGHYIEAGLAAGRMAQDQPAGVGAPVLPSIRADEGPDPHAPFAVVVHLYYHAMWDDFAARLRNQSFAFDLFVTLPKTGPDDSAIRARILADFPQARLWSVPNHGRDILPFLHLTQSGLLAPYSAVCKLHSKKSPHRSDGDAWRSALLDGVIGPPALTASRLRAFVSDPTVGLWVADGHRTTGAQWWGPNRDRGVDLLARAGLSADGLATDLVFAAGSIYWIKALSLAVLAALPVTGADFEAEMGQVDGTTAHALERVFGLMITAAGQQIRQASELDHQGQAIASVSKAHEG
jgi:hypothetical protein